VPTIEVEQLAKRYGAKVAVDDVTFSVNEGEVFGIIGPNGAGKTTTVECITGLRSRDRGIVRVLGHDPSGDRRALREQVGVQLQDCGLPANLQVAEALELYSSFYAHPADWRGLIEALGLGAVAATRFAKLSGGQRQRLSIALALVGNPRVAVLDELTTGLDPSARRDTWNLIEQVRDRGVTILLVTHFMQEAEFLCDRVAVIDRGRVVALDSPVGLLSNVLADQQVRFVPSVPVGDNLLSGLNGVSSVTRHGEEIVVIGTTDTLSSVTTALAVRGIVAHRLRVDSPTLDDAYLSIIERSQSSLHCRQAGLDYEAGRS
jgi:ABC-2 type transport system ATP-binding protein